MQNSYIVDAFLTGTAWMILIFLYFDIRARIKALNNMMNSTTLAVALSKSVKAATSFAVPFAALYLFLLWRFYAFMVQSQTWGAGGAGLVVILGIIGVLMVWLTMMLVFVAHSPFAQISSLKQNNDK
ncbi:hypothetical protein Q6344_06795 [Psychrobacter cibarius]|nr:hypothetical protein Q6344_06795 [Psychrobacter cibarius]